MKKMKLMRWGLLLALPLLMTMSGCKKYLDRAPLTATFNDLHQGELESQSFGLYSTLTSYAGFSSLPWIDFHSIRDDDAQKGSSTTDGAEINTEFETFQYTKDDWATDTYWNDHFYMINLANTELFDADSLKATDPASLRNVGEALFFRAYSYFELVKAYGDVPLINFHSAKPSDYNKPKSPAAQIYALIDSDLTVAARYLPLSWKTGTTNAYPGRLTSGAAKTLAAQTQIFRNNWATVKGLCNDVIASGQYSLDPIFYDIFKEGLNGAGKNGVESIFEMQAWVGANGGFSGSNYHGTAWGTSQQVRQGGASVTWNLGWGWNVPTQVLVSAWDNTDPRKGMTILYSGQSDGGGTTGGFGATLPAWNPGVSLDQPYWNKKVYSDPQMRTFTGEVGGAEWINHRILRYADVILMLAEASNELGDGATAETMLEMIRARARGTTSTLPHIAFANQAQMRTAIKNERRWEFAMEGYRFYDLVRWGDAVSVLGGLGYQPKNALYPIPQPAIDLSGGVLKQNPNY
jgi:hypothetical protein